MRASIEDARELIAEGDRLMGQAWERAQAAKGAVTDLDLTLAEDCFERAAQAYLVGAVEYQESQRGAEHPRFVSDEPDELIQRLDGHLGVEAAAALQAARRLPKTSAQASVYQAQSFAENVRDRFARALPELFNRPADTGVERSDSRNWSR